MPKVGPGQDNVSGDRYTLDLGVEPDLGNLLQNLQVSNELLEAAEEKFHSISDVVGSTTQRLAQATRQTQLLASETERLQNSYSQIANSSATLANMGQMAMGGMPGMMMPGMMMPGQMAFGGMPPAANMETIPAGLETPGQQEDIPEFEPPPPPQPGFPLSVRAAAIEELASKFTGGKALGPLGIAINKFRYGFQMRRHGKADSGIVLRLQEAAEKNAAKLAPVEEPAQEVAEVAEAPVTEAVAPVTEAVAPVTEADAVAPAVVEGKGLLDAAPTVAATAGLLGEGSALAGLGGAVGAAAPYVGAAYAAYKLWSTQMASARRLGGITGDTSLFGGVGGGSVGMKGQALWGSLINPGVDYTRAQEEALGTGAVGGEYEDTKDFLLEAAKRGMSDTIDMVDLYEEAVQKAGGTTEQLTSSIDRMRKVAANTNSSLAAMTVNYKANMEEFVNMGMAGGAANQAALMQSTAFAMNSPQAMMSPVLRNSGGYDTNNPYVKAQIASNNGMSYASVGIQTALNPVFGGNMPVKAENVITKSLTNYGFARDMTHDEIAQKFLDLGWQDYAGQILAAQGLLPRGVDPADLPSVISSIQTVMSHPVAELAKEMDAAGDLNAPVMDHWTGGDKIAESPQHYVEQTLGIDQHEGGILGFGDDPTEAAPLSQKYEKWMAAHGNQTSPIMDAVLQGTGHGANTFVKAPDGSFMPFERFINEHPDWQQLLNDESSQWRIGTATQEDMTGINAAQTKAERRSSISDIGFGSGDQMAQGELNGHGEGDGPSPNSSATVDLGAHTIERLAEAYKRAQD